MHRTVLSTALSMALAACVLSPAPAYATAGVTQVQERHRHHGQQRDRRFQAGDGRELHVFDLAARLLRLVVFLHNPSQLVPARNPPCILEGHHRLIGQQRPVDGLLARAKAAWTP